MGRYGSGIEVYAGRQLWRAALWLNKNGDTRVIAGTCLVIGVIGYCFCAQGGAVCLRLTLSLMNVHVPVHACHENFHPLTGAE